MIQELFSSRRDKVLRKRNFTWIRLQVLFKVNIKIFDKNFNCVDLHYNYQKLINNQVILKRQKPTLKLQTRSDLKCWRLWELALDKYLTNICLCRKFTLHTSTLLIISGHFKRFQLNHPPSQPTNFVNIFFYEIPDPPELVHFYWPGYIVKTHYNRHPL